MDAIPPASCIFLHLPLIPFQPCPNNERQTHHADHNTATEDSYSHENPSLPSGDRRNHHINPGYATSNFARSNVKRLLNAYR